MKQFKDLQGKVWDITINVNQIKRVRDRLGVDLGGLLASEAKEYRELMSNPVKFVDVVYVLCESQAQREGVTDTQFGESLAGDCFEDCMKAFEDELLFFYPKRQREMLQKVREKGEAVTTKAFEIATAKLDAIDMTEWANEILSASPTSLPG